jgi:hypothetical protein
MPMHEIQTLTNLSEFKQLANLWLHGVQGSYRTNLTKPIKPRSPTTPPNQALILRERVGNLSDRQIFENAASLYISPTNFFFLWH